MSILSIDLQSSKSTIRLSFHFQNVTYESLDIYCSKFSTGCNPHVLGWRPQGGPKGGDTNHASRLDIWIFHVSRLSAWILITVYCQELLGVSYICGRPYCDICMCSFIVGFCYLAIWQFLIAARMWLISPIILRFECCWLYMSGR
jgi:hypothetical protein